MGGKCRASHGSSRALRLLCIATIGVITVFGTCSRGSAFELARPAGVNPGVSGGIDGWVVLLANASLEQKLKVGTVGLLKSVRRLVRQWNRFLGRTAERWSHWGWTAVGVAVLGLLAPLMDSALWANLRSHGVAAVMRRVGVGAVIYVRVVVDRRTPMIGRALLVQAIIYGVAPYDLVPDPSGVVGYLDDLVVVYTASSGFIAMCDERFLMEHARAASAFVRLNGEEMKLDVSQDSGSELESS